MLACAACALPAAGHLIGHIKDIGGDPSDPNTRLYTTHAAQPWHNDVADLVSLLCLKQAKSGGHSSWCSSVTVHNEIVKRAPELAKVRGAGVRGRGAPFFMTLCDTMSLKAGVAVTCGSDVWFRQPGGACAYACGQVLAGPWWFYDRKGEIPPGKQPVFLIPVFNCERSCTHASTQPERQGGAQRLPLPPPGSARVLASPPFLPSLLPADHKGHLFINFSANYYYASQRYPEVRALSLSLLLGGDTGAASWGSNTA